MKILGKMLAVSLFLLVSACSSEEPVATKYKKEAGAATAEPGSGGTGQTGGGGGGTGTGGGGAANLQAGKTFYDSNGCANCHGATGGGSLRISAGPWNATSLQNVKAESTAHNGFPSGQALADLAAYIDSFP